MCQNESKYNEEELLAVPAENYRDFETIHEHDRKKNITNVTIYVQIWFPFMPYQQMLYFTRVSP